MDSMLAWRLAGRSEIDSTLRFSTYPRTQKRNRKTIDPSVAQPEPKAATALLLRQEWHANAFFSTGALPGAFL